MERRLNDIATISDIESDLEGAIEGLRELDHRGRLPYELRPLLQLAPPDGASVHVSMRQRETGRQVRRNALGDAWNPRNCAVWIVYEVPQSSGLDEGARGEPQGDPLTEFLQALDHAEHDPHLHFISLKWFRDTYLGKRGLAWAHDPDMPRRLIQEATERDLILTSKVPNPKQPSFPVTSIRLNREHPDVRKIVGEPSVADGPGYPAEEIRASDQ